MFAKRFPFAIYYELKDDIAFVAAILPMRRDPDWAKKAWKEEVNRSFLRGDSPCDLSIIELTIREMMKSRIISIVITVAYLIIAYFAGGGEALWRIAVFLILPLACIWFGRDMGGYTGLNFYTRPAITQTTPGCFVAFAGWLLLLLPGIIIVIVWLT